MASIKNKQCENILEETKKFPMLDYLQRFLPAKEEHFYILHTS